VSLKKGAPATGAEQLADYLLKKYREMA